jgi:hypothetical protein
MHWSQSLASGNRFGFQREISAQKACADPPAAPFARWVEGIMAEIERTTDHTGRKLIYAFNITDEINSGL